MVQTIESHDMTVDTLFNAFYVVPDYQREYVWEDREVEQLLQDAYGVFESDGDSDQEYFIGSVVVCSRPDGVFDLIDGQQRLTTAYILMCAVRDYLAALDADPPQAITNSIAATDIDANGNDVFRYRMDLQYEDSRDVLKMLAEKKDLFLATEWPTRSSRNIQTAYLTITAFLRERCGQDAAAVKRFYSFFVKRIKLIRIQTKNVTRALKIFETINERGRGLDSMDLLKNLLFMNASEQQFGKLKDVWKQLVDTLYAAHEKPLRFLRYFILASYAEERLREEEIYEWFSTNQDEIGLAPDPVGFAERLRKASEVYVRFAGGKDANGTRNRYLENIQAMSGAARQHLILLLSARHLSGAVFNELCRQVENLFFAYVITREATREFERRFVQWAAELRQVSSMEELQAFVRQRIDPAKSSLSRRFAIAFGELEESSLQKYRLKYVLAKLTQFVNERAYGSESSAADLATFINPKVQIEHILPQSPSPAALAEFDRPEDVDLFIRRLGNLTLVEQPLNASLGNKPYSEKRPVYPKSAFLLTATLGEERRIGVNTAVDRAVKGLGTYPAWTSSSVEGRQGLLRSLAHEVWEVPVPEQG